MKKSKESSRIKTITALISSNRALNSTAIYNQIETEFKKVVSVNSIKNEKTRHLLKILHSTRALDTTLKAVLDYHGIGYKIPSLGSYLVGLSNHKKSLLGKISVTEKNRYQKSIVRIRNLHLHTAGSYPQNSNEVSGVLSEMHALISRVTSL